MISGVARSLLLFAGLMSLVSVSEAESILGRQRVIQQAVEAGRRSQQQQAAQQQAAQQQQAATQPTTTQSTTQSTTAPGGSGKTSQELGAPMPSEQNLRNEQQAQTALQQQQQKYQQQLDAMKQQSLASTSNANMNDGAKKSSGGFNMGSMVNAAMGAMFMTQCKPPKVIYPCIMGALSLAQAAMFGGQKGGADNVANRTAFNPSGSVGEYQPVNFDWGDMDLDGDGVPDGQNAKVSVTPAGKTKNLLVNGRDINQLSAEAMKKLADQGFKFEGDKVTLPNGQVVPFSSLATEDGLLALGMTPAQAAAAKNAQSQLSSRLAGQLGAYEGGGGGGGGGGGARPQAANPFNFASMFGNQERKPASAAGLSVRYGNDSIGVAGDDIWKMMSKQYDKKEEQNYFVQEQVAVAPATAVPGMYGASAALAARAQQQQSAARPAYQQRQPAQPYRKPAAQPQKR